MFASGFIRKEVPITSNSNNESKVLQSFKTLSQKLQLQPDFCVLTIGSVNSMGQHQIVTEHLNFQQLVTPEEHIQYNLSRNLQSQIVQLSAQDVEEQLPNTGISTNSAVNSSAISKSTIKITENIEDPMTSATSPIGTATFTNGTATLETGSATIGNGSAIFRNSSSIFADGRSIFADAPSTSMCFAEKVMPPDDDNYSAITSSQISRPATPRIFTEEEMGPLNDMLSDVPEVPQPPKRPIEHGGKCPRRELVEKPLPENSFQKAAANFYPQVWDDAAIPFPKARRRELPNPGYAVGIYVITRQCKVSKTKINLLFRVCHPFVGKDYMELEKKEKQDLLRRAAWTALRLHNVSFVHHVFNLHMSTLSRNLKKIPALVSDVSKKFGENETLKNLHIHQKDLDYVNTLKNGTFSQGRKVSSSV